MKLNIKKHSTYLEDGYSNKISTKIDYTDTGILNKLGYRTSYFRENVYYVHHNILDKNYQRISDFNTIGDRNYEFVEDILLYKHNKLDFYISLLKTFDEKDKLTFSITKVHYNQQFDLTEILKELNQLKNVEIKNDSSIYLVLKTTAGFNFKQVWINPLDIDIDKMYNDDFKPVYNHIIKSLKESNKGIVMLHGVAGSGKTNIIKHLTTKVDKKFVFIPVTMINYLTDPTFLGELLEIDNSILVIEDCENYIQDRETSGNNNVVSSILNLTDGMLSDVIGLQVICTFNTDLTKIDKALLRSGRLIDEYKFGYLNPSKVKFLSEELKIELDSYNKVSLADIYNFKNKPHRDKKISKIGF